MWPGVVGPDDLRLLEGVLEKASLELRIESGSEDVLRGVRLGRAKQDLS